MRQTSVVVNHNSNSSTTSPNDLLLPHTTVMCSSTPTSRFSDTMLATIGPIGRTLISAMDLKLRCSANGCECANFIAAKDKLRVCDGCTHSWITHLFEKLLRDETLSIFDVCSLALYGTHALPIRLKIVIERLLGTLQPEEIDKILRSFGWTPPDLARGYMIQEPRGGLIERWTMLPREEEILILQQFLRFSPTRSLSFSLLRDDFQFNITQQQTQHQQLQQLLLPSPTAAVAPAPPETKVKTENSSALNLSSSVHSRNSRSTALKVEPSTISPPHHHHQQQMQSQRHHHHHSHSSHGHGHNHQHHNRRSHSRRDSSSDGDNVDSGGSQPPVDLSFNAANPKTSISIGVGSNSNNHHHHNTGNISNNNNHHPIPNIITKLSPEHRDERHHSHSEELQSHKEKPHPQTVQQEHQQHRSRSEKQIGIKPAVIPPAPILRQHHQHWSSLTSTPSQLVNPATGKRRVQCSVCLKTFCDKGALKIHFSAVHLREMHKCTVQGCNMMFSSRRSRNRHSANPNPKLHSPHLRRRISPHDGRSSNPMIPLPLLGAIMPAPFTNGSIKGEMDIGHHMDESHPMDEMDSCPSPNSPSSSSSSLTSEKSPLPEEVTRRHDGARKRKLSNPVRLPSVPDDSNDDFCCYDDGTEVLPHDDAENEEQDHDKEFLNQKSEREMQGQHDDAAEIMEDEELNEKNHLERLESLPIFSNHHVNRHSESPVSNDGSAVGSPNSPTGSDSIPIDKDNPRRCTECGKEFQNQFGVKTHFTNVHLKLLHKCLVDGCTASFPSRRSRDRHSANSNLHRKLLSTSDASNGSADDNISTTPPNTLVTSASSFMSSPPLSQQHQLFNPRNPFSPFLLNGTSSNPTLNQITPAWNPFLPFPVFPNVFNTSPQSVSVPMLPPSQISGVPSNRIPQVSSSPPKDIIISSTPNSTSPLKDGFLECKFCSKRFEQTSALLSHLESAHSTEAHHRCRQCNALFVSRKKLESHSCCVNNNNNNNNGI